MSFLRPLEYFLNRFHYEQENTWLAYKAGKHIVQNWGRRSGKTQEFAEIVVEDVEDYGKDCMYLTISQRQGREIFTPVMNQVLKNQLGKTWKYYPSRLEYQHMKSGAIVTIKGVDVGKDKIRGSGKRIIILDEFAFWRDPSVVKEVVVPMLADHNGQMLVGSTPKGYNHFHKLVERAKLDDDYYFSSCTMFQNPFISEKGREMLIKEYDGIDDALYRQEILGEFVVFEGLVFALEKASYTTKTWDRGELDHCYHWRGVDHGFSPDPTACLWMAYSPRRDQYLIYNEYKQSKLLIKEHADLIKEKTEWELVETYSDIDPQIIAEYEEVGLSMTPAEKTSKDLRKQARLLKLVQALRTNKLKISIDCVGLLDEMANYVWDQDGGDHLIDSMNYVYNNAGIPAKTEPVKDNLPDRMNFPQKEEDNYQGFQPNYDE